MNCPKNSARIECFFFQGFGRVGTLARVASSESCLKSTQRLGFWAGGSMAWSVLKIYVLESTTFSLSWYVGALAPAASSEFCLKSTSDSVFVACWSGTAWNVLVILFEMDGFLKVLGGWERWRMERPQNSAWNRRPSRCFSCVVRVLARGVLSEFCLQSTTFLMFVVRWSAGAWSVVRILRCLWRVGSLARGTSSDFCWESTILSVQPGPIPRFRRFCCWF